jgi:hypothetical protein
MRERKREKIAKNNHKTKDKSNYGEIISKMIFFKKLIFLVEFKTKDFVVKYSFLNLEVKSLQKLMPNVFFCDKLPSPLS